MKIGQFMSTEVTVLSPAASLRDVAALFLEQKIDGAPVVEEGKVKGLFTRTHLLRAISQGEDFDCPVVRYMTVNVRSVHPDDNILEVDVSKSGRYPVIKDGTMVGFITKSDIMNAMNQILGEISGQMETVINSAYNPIVAIDAAGLITIWNHAIEKLTHYKSQDAIGKHIHDIVPESNLLNVIKTGQREMGIKLNVFGIPAITNRAPIVNNGAIVGAVAVLYDMSELEAVSCELKYVKALNAEMDAIINSSFDGLYITDDKAITLRTNRAIKRVTGLDEEVFLNKSMNELVDSGILSRSATLLTLERKAPATTTLTTITGRTLLVSATPVFDEQGNIYRVVTNVRDISELNMLKQKLEQMEGLKKHFEFQINQMRLRESGEMLFKNREMEKILYQAVKIAEVDSTVLLSGESGVGKEVLANIIQRISNRRDKPFVKLNCAAIPENLIESELFGYETGAFTGARKDGKPGLFEVANRGTLLLDEIGDIPLHLQVKLLRALQEREIFRVGGTEAVKIDVRIIAITNKNLEDMVRRGEFREDLFYRLNVVPIHIPPLRERREDIPLLITNFVDYYNERYNLNKSMDPEVIEILVEYDWPGNIRQLENMVERLVVTSTCENIGVQYLPAYFYDMGQMLPEGDQDIVVKRIVPLKRAVETLERSLLEKTFSLAGSCVKAAEILGVDPSTISRKAAKYGIK